MLADIVLALHALLATAIAAGFLLIPLGARCGWSWVRRRTWRVAHLAAMLIIAGETLAGLACPLTVLEDSLRGRPGADAGFIGRWLATLLYWPLPAWVFAVLYTVLALLALILWRQVPPRRG